MPYLSGPMESLITTVTEKIRQRSDEINDENSSSP